MKSYMFVTALLAATCWSIASQPMESVDRYNIVLVHGAADRWQGLDCENGDRGTRYAEAYSNKQGVVTDLSSCRPDTVEVFDIDNLGAYKDSVFMRCDTAYYNPARVGGVKMPSGNIGGTATGMMKEMFQFLGASNFRVGYAGLRSSPPR